eukprot:1160418-Rhodomonas_salina.2
MSRPRSQMHFPAFLKVIPNEPYAPFSTIEETNGDHAPNQFQENTSSCLRRMRYWPLWVLARYLLYAVQLYHAMRYVRYWRGTCYAVSGAEITCPTLKDGVPLLPVSLTMVTAGVTHNFIMESYDRWLNPKDLAESRVVFLLQIFDATNTSVREMESNSLGGGKFRSGFDISAA